MNTQELKNKLIESGAKVWTKEDHERIYLNSNDQLIAIGAKITNAPKFLGETSGLSNKSKIYFDVKKEVFFADTGCLVNTLKELGFKAVRI